SHGQLGCPLLDSSGDLSEVAETDGLDHLGLHGRDVLVGLVGAKGRADDAADSAAALGLTGELTSISGVASTGGGAAVPSRAPAAVDARVVIGVSPVVCAFCGHCGCAGSAGAAGSGCGAPARSARRTRIAAVLMARVSSAMAAAARNARA